MESAGEPLPARPVSAPLPASAPQTPPHPPAAPPGSELSSARSSNSSRLVLMASPDKSEIATMLECPVCYEIMIPPIISCAKGHNVCSECRARVRHCPVCREVYTPGNLRNLFAEQLANKCKMLCKYKNSGCEQVLTGNVLRAHQLACDYRPLTCPDCDSTVAYEHFLQHIQDHEVVQVRQSEYSTGYEIQFADYTSPPQKWELTWLFAHNCNFLCHTEKHDTCWSFWISCAENNEHLDDFLCEIVLWNKERRSEVKYTGPINSIRTKPRDVLANSSGLIMTKDSIRAYVYRGGVDVIFRIIEAEYESPLVNFVGQVEEQSTTPTPVAVGATTQTQESGLARHETLENINEIGDGDSRTISDNEYSDFDSARGEEPAAAADDSWGGGDGDSNNMQPIPGTRFRIVRPQNANEAGAAPLTPTPAARRSVATTSTATFIAPRSDGDGAAAASPSTAATTTTQDRRLGRPITVPPPVPTATTRNARGGGSSSGSPPLANGGRGRGARRGRDLPRSPNELV